MKSTTKRKIKNILLIDKIIQYKRNLEDTHKQLRDNKGRQIQFYNFWDQPFDDIYWNRFFGVRPELLKNKTQLSVGFFSVFGDRKLINKTKCDVNIFYTAENVKCRFNYSDHFLTEHKIDLSMGFEYFEDDRYIRFPNWMDVFFLKYDEIIKICNSLRCPDTKNKKKFASLICSHDNVKGTEGLRTSILDAVNDIDFVSCAGFFRHNDDTLKMNFHDNKIDYLKQFKFNICPENSNSMGYVTEKIFQSIKAGCIPIYWGSCNRPELEVLNQDAIIFWNKDGDNSDALKLIQELNNSPKLMSDFLNQPRLVKNADEYILNTLYSVENKMRSIIKSKF